MTTRLHSLVHRSTPLMLLLAIALGLAFTSVKLLAQTETGQITGTVLDPTGAVVPVATVTAVDLATKATRTATTSNGGYAFPNLLPGRYEVTGAATGFETVKQTVLLTIGSKVGLDFHLTVGSVSTVVEVAESAVQVNVETQTQGANLTASDILNLPTLTRNPYELVQTVGNTTASDPAAGDRGVGLSMNGLRSSDVGILLDGVPNIDNFTTQVGIETPLDSVGEITVITNTPTAEFGRALAGIVNVDTKRGTNAFHGTAYEFNRVSALTSNYFENNAYGIPVSPFTRNQFGFSIGGPIKKDKLFVFANPEWLRVRSTGTITAVIPTPQLIAASAPATQDYFRTYGTLAPGVIPLQTFTRGAVCTTGACTAIAASTPFYQKVAYNVPASSGGGAPDNTLQFAGRIDYNYSDKTQFYFRYARVDTDNFVGTVTNSPYLGYNTGETVAKNIMALSATHIFSATMVGQTKLSFNRLGDTQPLGAAPVGPTLYTAQGGTSAIGGAPFIYPGYVSISPGLDLPFGGAQNYYQGNEDITKVFGNHNLRFGGLYTVLNDNRTFGAYENAVAGLGTNLNSAVNGLVTGRLANFQAAINPQGKFPCVNGPSGPIVVPACTLTLPVGEPNFSRSNLIHEAALYVQDSWKLRPRLTLNLGVRWEYYGPQSNRNQALDSNFFFGPGANIELASGTGQLLTSTSPQNPIGGLWQRDWKDFEPRIGIAYDLFGDGKTSFRAGYGIGYEPNFGNVTFNVIQNPPNYAVVSLTSGVEVPTIPITTNNAGPFAGSSGTKALGRTSLRDVNPYIKTAYAQLFSASLEHQFTSDFLVALEYSGSIGTNLYSIDVLNIPGSAAVYGGRGSGSGSVSDPINPQYGLLKYRTNDGESAYNGINLRTEFRNFRRQGLTLRFNYTVSHAIDNISNTFSETSTGSGNVGLLDPLNPGLDRGSAEFDSRQRVLLTALWEIPGKFRNKAVGAVLGGWTFSPNFSARSGSPFTLWDCSNAAYASCPRAMYDAPFHASYTNTPVPGNPNLFNYMNVGNPDSSYANPIVGVSDFGPYPATMTGRDVFREPGVWNMDLAVHKNFAITERFRLQFRAEAFNVFNHSNLYVVTGATDVSAESSVFTQRGVRQDNPNALAFENRNLQLALKLIF